MFKLQKQPTQLSGACRRTTSKMVWPPHLILIWRQHPIPSLRRPGREVSSKNLSLQALFMYGRDVSVCRVLSLWDLYFISKYMLHSNTS